MRILALAACAVALCAATPMTSSLPPHKPISEQKRVLVYLEGPFVGPAVSCGSPPPPALNI